MSAHEQEHDRQMAAIHQARAAMPSLSAEARDAHAALGDRYERRAQRATEKAARR